MKKQDCFEPYFKEALSSTAQPTPSLNQTLKARMEEAIPMKKRVSLFLRPAVAVALVAMMSVSAWAAWHILSPADVADQLGHTAVAEAFRGDEAIILNEAKSKSGYDVTFLGMVSGQGLNQFAEDIQADQSYAVLAIAKQDGSAMPKTSDPDYGATPFFVSPLIHGQTPWLYNIASMGGGYSACVIDGVLYYMIACDDLEMFADRGLSLVVSSTSFYSVEAFNYDAKTGMVTPNPAFEGVNLVFDLPLDPAKADPEKAAQYLANLWEQEPSDDTASQEAQGNDIFAQTDADGNISLTEKPQ